MKRILVVVICVAVGLTIPVGVMAKDWEKIDMAAKCVNGRIEIIQAYHDSAVVGSTDKIRWKLTCIDCPVSGNTQYCGGMTSDDEVKYWIQSVDFQADLDDAAELMTGGEDTIDVKKTRTVSGGLLVDPTGFYGETNGGTPSRVAKAGKELKSKAIPGAGPEFPTYLHELWKFTVVAATEASGITGPGDFTPAACDAVDECDYWDPHIYVHGDGKPGI